MNTDCFQTREDGFDALDLRIRFSFKTSSSIGFDVAMERFHGTILGAIQVHHPCPGHIKARVYVQLPKQYNDAKLLVSVLQAAFRELQIPLDETYELSCDTSG